MSALTEHEETAVVAHLLFWVHRLGLLVSFGYVCLRSYWEYSETQVLFEHIFYHLGASVQIYAVFVVITVMTVYILCNLKANEFLVVAYCFGMWAHSHFEFEPNSTLKPIHSLLIR